MANAYLGRVNRTASYRTSTGWRPCRITAVDELDDSIVDLLDADGVTEYLAKSRRTDPVNPAPIGTWRP